MDIRHIPSNRYHGLTYVREGAQHESFCFTMTNGMNNNQGVQNTFCTRFNKGGLRNEQIL